MNYNRKFDMQMGAGAQAKAPIEIGKRLSTHFRVEAYRGGKLLWADEFDNLVVNVGLDDSLDKHFKGSNYTAAFYVGLTDGTPTVAAGDTMESHAGWTEVTAYDEANRQTLSLGAVSSQSVNNSASKATFTIDADNTTMGGAFVVTDNTRGGTAGTLYGGGVFTAGDKTIDDDDTIQVTVTLTAAAS